MRTKINGEHEGMINKLYVVDIILDTTVHFLYNSAYPYFAYPKKEQRWSIFKTGES